MLFDPDPEARQAGLVVGGAYGAIAGGLTLLDANDLDRVPPDL